VPIQKSGLAQIPHGHLTMHNGMYLTWNVMVFIICTMGIVDLLNQNVDLEQWLGKVDQKRLVHYVL
jgi:hypothetical protein